jgi:hypothetical protein
MIFARGGWLFLSSPSDYFSLPLSVRFVKFCRETKLIGAVGQDTELQSMLVGSSPTHPLVLVLVLVLVYLLDI